MLFTHLWAIVRPEYEPLLQQANEARAAAFYGAWRKVRDGVSKLISRPEPLRSAHDRHRAMLQNPQEH